MLKTDEFALDLKDKRILYELDLDARQPNSKIAKKVGLSTEVVNYRIKRLEKENIITQYQTIIDYSRLGILQFKILLTFQHLNSEKLNEIIEKLKKNSSVKWVVSCKGNWDLIISLQTDSLEKIDLLKNEILALFENYIDKKAISILVEASVYNRNYLLDKQLINRTRSIFSASNSQKIDSLDLDIIKKLSENARISIVDLSVELNKTPRIINYRIKQLIKNKIISGFRIAINYKKLGIHFYKIFIHLDNIKQDRIKKLVNYLAANKNIIHHVKVLGNWDLEPEFEVYSEEEFDKILVEIKNEFSDILKNVEIITILKEHKFVYF